MSHLALARFRLRAYKARAFRSCHALRHEETLALVFAKALQLLVACAHDSSLIELLGAVSFKE